MKAPFVNIAVQAARSAASLIMRAVDRLDTIKVTQKQPNDFVTEIDQAAEKEIISIIHKAYPKHGFLAEEQGEIAGNDYIWIIDPIDGTRNYIHGFPHFAISIALRVGDKIEHGVIYDPVRNELFTASRGRGAQLNERRIRVSQRTRLEECLFGTGFPYRHSPALQKAYLNSLNELMPHCGDLRRAGAATLDLAYVASGRLDGFWELGLKPWDVAAGSLLVREAGGLLADIDGSDDYLKTGNIVAGNPKTLKLLLQAITPYFNELNLKD